MVMNSLVRNVGETGDNVSKFGENGDKFYGIAQCMGDLDTSAFGGCVEQATKALLQNCHTFLAYIYLGRCFLLYQTFDLHTKVIFLDVLVCNNTNNTNIIDERIFDWSIASLLTQLVVNTANSSNADYITLSGKAVYAMARCWKGLLMDNCRLRLNAAYQQLIKCPQGSLENWVLYESCIICYDKYKFYGDPVLHNSGGLMCCNNLTGTKTKSCCGWSSPGFSFETEL